MEGTIVTFDGTPVVRVRWSDEPAYPRLSRRRKRIAKQRAKFWLNYRAEITFEVK